jgi:tRNA 2-selenouridine synthase SelU
LFLSKFKNQGEIMSVMKTHVLRFLELAECIPVIDVRSPSEFLMGHIPGAINIPLFDDMELPLGLNIKKKGVHRQFLKD